MDEFEISTQMTWSQFGAQYMRFAETAEKAACQAMRLEATRAFATAQAMQSIMPTLAAAL